MWPNQDEALRDIAVAISEMISNHPLFGNAYLKIKQANEELYSKKKAELQILVSSHQDFIQKLLENFTGAGKKSWVALRQQISALRSSWWIHNDLQGEQDRVKVVLLQN